MALKKKKREKKTEQKDEHEKQKSQSFTRIYGPKTQSSNNARKKKKERNTKEAFLVQSKFQNNKDYS